MGTVTNMSDSGRNREITIGGGLDSCPSSYPIPGGGHLSLLFCAGADNLCTGNLIVRRDDSCAHLS
jgi:hypothetical protein